MAGPCPLLGERHPLEGCCREMKIKAQCWGTADLSEMGLLLVLLLMDQLVFSGMFRCLTPVRIGAP